MQPFHLIVGPDGRVAIPNTQPGQTVTGQIAASPDDNTGPIPEEEREAIKERVMRLAREIRDDLRESWRSAEHSDLPESGVEP